MTKSENRKESNESVDDWLNRLGLDKILSGEVSSIDELGLNKTQSEALAILVEMFCVRL